MPVNVLYHNGPRADRKNTLKDTDSPPASIAVPKKECTGKGFQPGKYTLSGNQLGGTEGPVYIYSWRTT